MYSLKKTYIYYAIKGKLRFIWRLVILKIELTSIKIYL
jgi:hypothetical protein